jgi:DNA-binding SARP family transcriptional activator
LLDIRLLGPLDIVEGSHRPVLRGTKLRAILALLALNATKVVGRDELVEELDLAKTAKDATNALHAHVVRLRNWLESEHHARSLLRTSASGYCLDLPPGRVDAHRFTQVAERSATTLLPLDPVARVAELQGALAMWRGAPLCDVGDGPMCRLAADVLQEQHREMQESLLDGWLTVGDNRRVVIEAKRLISHDPLRERSWEQLMMALHAGGRSAEAIEAYRKLRGMLVREIGLEPGPKIQRRLQMILNDPPVDVGRFDRIAHY